MARFLDNDRIVVCPDDVVDHNGHHSGNGLEIIDVRADRIVSEIKPKNFGPKGELVISPDRSHFAVYSHYVNPWVELADGLLPNFHKPELLLFQRDERKPELMIPNLDLAGQVAFSTNRVLPSLSSSASVVAVAQGGAIKVFKVKE